MSQPVFQASYNTIAIDTLSQQNRLAAADSEAGDHRQPHSPGPPSPWFAIFVLLSTALVFAPCLRFGFVYDDVVQILRNPRLAAWSSVPDYFRHHIWIHVSNTGSYYRPLFLTWLRTNAALWGTRALGWHLSTLLIHLLATLLLYLLLRRTVRSPFVAAVATAVFALHPAHIESVAWVSGVTDPLMTVFLLGSLLCWLRYRENHRLLWNLGSLFLLVFSLMVKESAVFIPLLMFLYAVSLSGKNQSQPSWFAALRSTVPAIAVTALYFIVSWRVLRPEAEAPVRTLHEAFLNAPALAWFYTKHLVWPLHLSVIYDFELHPSRASLWLAILLSAALLAIFYFTATRARSILPALGWIWFSIAIAIAGITVFEPHDYVHDRYLYLPVIGLGILVGTALEALPARRAELFGYPATRVIAAGLLLPACAYATETQLWPWTNNRTLFIHAVRSAPENPMSYVHLAFELYKEGNPQAAIDTYRKGVALDPNDWHSAFGLAVLYYRTQQWQYADFYCGEANRISPDSNNTCYQFQSQARMQLGEYSAAEIPIRYAIAHWPNIAGQHLMLAQSLAAQGKRREAADEYRKELQIDPNSELARKALADLPE